MLTVNPDRRPLCTEISVHLWFRGPPILKSDPAPTKSVPDQDATSTRPSGVLQLEIFSLVYWGAGAIVLLFASVIVLAMV